MKVVNARQFHIETSAILDAVSKGKAFQIMRKGILIATLQPAGKAKPNAWNDIMENVWAAQEKTASRIRNPVILKRKRRRR
jgi:antitoxin (DNA-binding transcriptional repressor) of toxin-antitoxin stability system